MLGASTLATVLSGKGKVADVASFAVSTGLHVVLDRPGTKIPMCILGDRARKQADEQAITDALAAGKPRPERARHACGIAHALGPEHKQHVRTLIARLEKRHGTVNVGIELGASRVVVVDVDTADEDGAFRGWLAAHGALGPQMTVRSPGKIAAGTDADGQPRWAHKDGGHYWFELPAGVELPTGADAGALVIEHGGHPFTVYWANRQVLIPPSSRPEGDYVFTGAPIVALPVALLEALVEASAVRANAAAVRLAEHEQRGAAGDDAASTVDTWDARTPWASLLEPDGWLDTGKIDNCGCPIWTAPGEHGSYKSATAHDLGCARFDTDAGWGPLRIWTTGELPDGLEGNSTITKLDYLARVAGMTRSEMAGQLGLVEHGDDVEFEPTSHQPLDEALPPRVAEPSTLVDAFEDAAEPTMIEKLEISLTDKESYPDNEKLEPWQELLARAKSSAQLRNEPALAPLVDGLIDQDSTFRITGPSGAGKTFVTLDLAACLATDQPWHGKPTHADGRPVVYVVAEGAAGFKRRLWAWEQENNSGEAIGPDRLLVFDFAIQIKDQAGWKVFRQALQHLNPCFVVLDTQARVTVGMEENSATDMGIAIARIDLIRVENPGSCVGTVHHTGYDGAHGRGSTAVYGSVNTEIMISKDGDGQITVSNEKQKDDVEFEPITLTLRQVDIPDALDRPAAVIEHGDPFDATVAISSAEPVALLSEDITQWPDVVRACRDDLVGFNDQGWSITDLMGVVLGFANLPEVKVSPNRKLLGERRARVRVAVDGMVDSGELERLTKGSFRWP